MTGGAQGLGVGIVEMLVMGGAKVAIFDVQEAKAKEAVTSMGSNVISCTVDVSNEDSVKAGFKYVMDSFGRVNIMVNCAGIVGPNAVGVDEVSCKDFDRVYESKLCN